MTYGTTPTIHGTATYKVGSGVFPVEYVVNGRIIATEFVKCDCPEAYDAIDARADHHAAIRGVEPEAVEIFVSGERI